MDDDFKTRYDIPDWMRRALDGDDSDIPIQTYAEHRAELLELKRQTRIEDRMRASNYSYEQAEDEINLEDRAEEIYDANKDWGEDWGQFSYAYGMNEWTGRKEMLVGVSEEDVIRQAKLRGYSINAFEIYTATIEGLKEYAEETLWEWSYRRAEEQVIVSEEFGTRQEARERFERTGYYAPEGSDKFDDVPDDFDD